MRMRCVIKHKNMKTISSAVIVITYYFILFYQGIAFPQFNILINTKRSTDFECVRTVSLLI